MRTDLEVIRDLIAECDQEAVGCDAKAQWLWAQDRDQEAEEMVDLTALYQARSRALSAALEVLDPVRINPVPQDPEGDPRPPLRSTLRLHVNPERAR